MTCFLTDQNVPKIMIFEVCEQFVSAKKRSVLCFVFFISADSTKKKKSLKCADLVETKCECK